MEALQGFLRENNVEFQTDPAPEQLEAVREDAAAGEEGEVVEAGGGAGANAQGLISVLAIYYTYTL